MSPQNVCGNVRSLILRSYNVLFTLAQSSAAKGSCANPAFTAFPVNAASDVAHLGKARSDNLTFLFGVGVGSGVGVDR